jgi:SAM-dependent methyltransferase
MEGCSLPRQYDPAFHERLAAGSRSSADVLVPLVLEMVPARSVVDVGCGLGHWLAAFRDLGVDDVVGVEGSSLDPEALVISRERVELRDLSRPFELDRTFDLVLALEVGEHLPAVAAEGFVESLTRLGPVVLFSAAIPAQGGRNHVNEQWPDYWARCFAACGFAVIDELRFRVWQDRRVAPWYAQNVLLFVRSDRLGSVHRRSSDLQGTGGPLPLVHPRLWLDVPGEAVPLTVLLRHQQAVLRRLPRSVGAAVSKRLRARLS